MVTNELISFIEKLIARKTPRKRIVGILKKQGGWSDEDIERAFNKIKEKSSTAISSVENTSGKKDFSNENPKKQVSKNTISINNEDITNKKKIKTSVDGSKNESVSLAQHKNKKGGIVYGFIIIFTLLTAGFLSFYFLKHDLSTAEILQQTFIQSQKIYSATNSGRIDLNIKIKELGVHIDRITADKIAVDDLILKAEYTYKYDVSQTINPIGEGDFMLALSGYVNDKPIEIKVKFDAKLIDSTLYLRFSEVQNVPAIPIEILDLDPVWIAIDLNNIAELFSSDLDSIFVERRKIKDDYAYRVEDLFTNNHLSNWINKSLIRIDDVDINGNSAYTFSLELNKKDIDLIKRMSANYLKLYQEPKNTIFVSNDIATKITSGAFDELFLSLLQSKITISIGKADKFSRNISFAAASDDVGIGNKTIDFDVKFVHNTNNFNNPISVRIAGDMIALETLLRSMDVRPAIVTPEQLIATSTSPHNDVIFMSIN